MKWTFLVRHAPLLLLHFICSNCLAQTPELTVKDQPNSVYLKSLKTSITVTGNIAVTTLEMTFFNSSNRIQEGELLFPLPESASVSRYAIDINGALREAVPVEKEKGTRVFEAVEHRRIDPGLLEKTSGNNFRTRIYPIPANGSRTVLIAYNEALLANDQHTLRYRLPMDYRRSIEKFRLEITVVQSSVKPHFTETPEDNLAFSEWNNNYSAVIEKDHFTPGHSVAFSLPKNPDAPEAMMQQVGANYYFLVNSFLQKQTRAKEIPDNIAVIWDVSLSGLSRDTKKELQLLGSYIEKKQNLSVRLATVNNEYKNLGAFTIRQGNWEALKKTIEHLTYDGGTNFSKINLAATPGAEYLFFSDGLSTLSDNQFELTGRPVYGISAAPKADYAFLQSLSQRTGGSFINLNALNAAEALRVLTEQSLQLLCIKQNDAISEHYPAAPQPVINSCSVAGISTSARTALTLQYGYDNKILFEKTVQLNYQQQSTQVNLQKIWAQKKIAELEMDDERNHSIIGQLGKQFSIVTRNTSLIVLENVADYVQYEIEPPADLRAVYDQMIKERRADRQTQQVLAMNNATRYFEELMQWWNQDYKTTIPVKNYQYRMDTVNAAAANLSEVIVTGYSNNRAGNADQTERRNMRSTTTIQADNLEALEGLVAGVAVSPNIAPGAGYVVTGNKKRKEEEGDGSGNASINIKQWTPQRSYLTAMAATGKEQRYGKYLELRKEYLSTPSFYFDMACYFFQQKDSATGAMVLGNLAELDLENHELYKLLGFKLKETRQYTEEAYVYRKILQWRPQEPQSYRDYGLALADAGRYQQALDTLYTAISKQYDGDVMSRYNGIEEIIVTEINGLLANHGNDLHTDAIDKKLLHPMPVDVRVVLNWNMNDTDIDLWLTDPNGEKCYYSHKNTAIGGRISNDFTNGYGPEQFLLKKAIKGIYTIEADFYGERQMKLAGPTTVMAELYTHYSDGREEKKIITVQLEKTERHTLLVGRFSFEK